MTMGQKGNPNLLIKENRLSIETFGEYIKLAVWDTFRFGCRNMLVLTAFLVIADKSELR